MGNVCSSKHSYHVGGGRVTGRDIVRNHNEPRSAEEQNWNSNTGTVGGRLSIAFVCLYQGRIIIWMRSCFVLDIFCALSQTHLYFFLFYFGSEGVHICTCVKSVNPPTSIHLQSIYNPFNDAINKDSYSNSSFSSFTTVKLAIITIATHMKTSHLYGC